MATWREEWDKKMNSKQIKFPWSGCYYQFQTTEKVLDIGTDGDDISGTTPCALTSCTKPFAGTAVMRTMHLKPKDWYPDKAMHLFEGWEEWKNFPVLDNEDVSEKNRKAEKITIHQLLTHTNGWPFGLRGSRRMIKNTPLYFKPGDGFGYSIGHRLLGWMLLDYWKKQSEFQQFFKDKRASMWTEPCLNDVFNFLVFDPLGMSEGTMFIKGKFEEPHSVMGEYFDMKFFDKEGIQDDDDPADLAMQATGEDMMKLCMMAMRRGRLPDGSWYIRKWDEWAGVNKLPDGKLSKACATWKMAGMDVAFLWRTAITRTTNAGPFGWNYFGATYHDYPDEGMDNAGPVIAVGWKGFSSCGLRADYKQKVAFVVMQEIVPDPGSRNFGECIHKGIVGSHNLITVGEGLDEENVKGIPKPQYEGTPSCLHDLMSNKPTSGCLVQCIRGIVKCALGCALPAGVRVLDFHRRERV
jgi:CubicO group peptidase (beta-lactamase class C family)